MPQEKMASQRLSLRYSWPAQGLLGSVLLGLCTTAMAENINVSQFVTGTSQPLDFAVAATLPILSCGSCNYSASASAGINKNSNSLMPHAWPAPTQTGLPLPPSVNQSVATVQGAVDSSGYPQYYDSNYWQRADVSFSSSLKSTSSQTFASGSANTVLAYHIHVTNNAATARDYFVDFSVPKPNRTINAAYTLIPGDNGGTYSYYKQKSAFSRSQVEVLADGLPVWTQSSTYNFPDDFVGYAWDKINIDWGSKESNRVLLYLGKLPAQSSLTLEYIVRTDARADAKECGIESSDPWNPQYYHHCFNLIETRSLPAVTTRAGYALDFKVYAKEVP